MRSPEKMRRWKLLIAFLIMALLSAAALPLVSDAALAAPQELLREIEGYIRNYYFYPPSPEIYPLTSLEDLEEVFKDPYSLYLREEQYRLFEESLSRSFSGVGIYLEKRGSFIEVVSTVPGSPAWRAGIAAGDVIIAIDGRPAFYLSLEEAVALIQGEAGTRVTLTLRRGEGIFAVTMVREKIRLPAVEYTWEKEGIALVRIYNFGEGAARDMEQLLATLEREGLRGLVLDLRGNSGGYLEEALEMASLFSGGVLLRVREGSSSWEEIQAPAGKRWSHPAVLLMDRGTASAAEIFAAALKDNRRALLVGEVSFGKGTMQRIFELEHGGYLKLTVAEFASPRGRPIEGVGVEPHFLLPSREKQRQVALQLLELKVAEAEGAVDFWEALLASRSGPQDSRPLAPLRLEGEIYLPLRAVLLLTGRVIQRDAETGSYFFTWEGRLYLLHIQEGCLSWSSPVENMEGSRICRKVVLREGITYVPLSFLNEELGFGVKGTGVKGTEVLSPAGVKGVKGTVLPSPFPIFLWVRALRQNFSKENTVPFNFDLFPV